MTATIQMKSPVTWFGGKGMLVGKLLPLVPKHDLYCEVFGGGAALLFAKEPSPVEVYNDLDSGLVHFFRVLREPELFEEFQRLCTVSLWSREEFYHFRETWADADGAEKAFRWFVVARQSFGGLFGGSWSSVITHSRRGMAGNVSRWLSVVDGLDAIVERMRRVQVEHADFRDILKRYDTPETFFYLDPPYIHATRRSCKYQHELTEADHADLVGLLLGLKGNAVLSGYAHPLYAPLESAGWAKHSFAVSCHSTGTTRSNHAADRERTEVVWLSPNCREVRG